MADERARKLTESALNRLAAELQAGKSEAPQELPDPREISPLWLLERSPDCFSEATATRVAGIYTWNKLGRMVYEGEKGIIILAPVLKREREETRTPQFTATPLPVRTTHPGLWGSALPLFTTSGKRTVSRYPNSLKPRIE